MTTSAVGRLVAEWRKRGNELARNGEVSVTLYAEGMRLQLCADELEALATAPPEAKPISAWIEQQQQTTPREMATAPPEQAALEELQAKYDSLKFQWDSLQDHEHARFVAETERAVSAGALSTLVEKWRAHRSGFVYTDATYRNCAEELEAALAVGLSAKQMPYSGSLREAIGTCAYQLEQFVRAAILTPGQKERLLEIRTRLLQDLAAATPALAAHDQKVRERVLEEVDKKVRELPRFGIVEVLAAIRSLASKETKHAKV